MNTRYSRGPAYLAMLLSTIVSVVAVSGCGSTSPVSPGATVTVTSVSPAAITTGGGTTITITGTNFGTDATVSVGGSAATGLTITGTSISATAPAHGAGSAAIIVTTGGKSVTYAGAFSFVAPSGANAPPVISVIRTTGTRPNQPASFADINDAIAVAATVTDAETSPGLLTYTWSATTGTITGTGATVSWKAPATITPSPTTVVLTLVVAESYVEAGVTHRQSSTGTAAIFLHDTTKELLDMGEDFLRLFSLQVPPAQVLHNFSQTCDGGGGYSSEFSDTVHNQDYFKQLPTFSVTRLPPITIAFGGTFPPYGLRADANSLLRVHWDAQHIKSSDPDFGKTDHVDGIDYVTGVLEGNQWRLCHSSFTADGGAKPLAGHHSVMIIR